MATIHFSDPHGFVLIRFWYPGDCIGSEAEQIDCFLEPCVGFRGSIHLEFPAGDSFLPHVPTAFGFPGCKEADEVCHVAAADKNPAAIDWVSDHLGDPTNGLGFDFVSERCEGKQAHILVYGCSEKISQCADRRRRRGDVPEEPGMSVEEI